MKNYKNILSGLCLDVYTAHSAVKNLAEHESVNLWRHKPTNVKIIQVPANQFKSGNKKK